MVALYAHLLLYLAARLQAPLRLLAELLLVGALTLAAGGVWQRRNRGRQAAILRWPERRSDAATTRRAA